MMNSMELRNRSYEMLRNKWFSL